ncbi:MAG: 4-hydroxy-tetrahydrodipicolinate reductase [Ignavibacteria bacterium]|jgi:4-hydroxy-tetrahydrodipicolinate reductase
MIKTAIVGYGKMGKEIESILDRNVFTLTGTYDIDNKIRDNMKEKPEVAIEFSTPSSMFENIEFLASKNINIVCGTTGWYDKIESVKKLVEKNNIGFIYASNFSLGVNIFYSIVKYAAGIFNKFEGYDLAVEDIHHRQKLDRPSGTALKLAEILMQMIKRKEKIGRGSQTDTGLQREGKLLDVTSTRVGGVVGIHKVMFDSPSDSILLEHSAKSRRGFAEGALLAAKFIYNKKGFYKFEEIFNNLI